MAGPMEKIQILDDIEKDIITCLQCAAQALLELGKEKSSQKQAESNTTQFLRTLSQVESKLSDQINYLTQFSTGQPHEGSGYASQKVLQMAWHRLEHVRSWVNELERLKTTQLASAPRSSSSSVSNGNMTSSGTST
ncbi:mediator of RNA polymerase II transcription subunit 11 [Epargyreus clarus]|uniref:mediator of RNA polymerase II transcription subunit 11 n=1 Tax=Epargyreus clarus TaxID=520877 RepID=UPI003C2AE6D1